MEFDPNNAVVQRCLQGMVLEENDKPEEARKLFLQAWDEATNDFERFTAAYCVASQQQKVSDKIKWTETALQHARQLNDDTVKAAFPLLYSVLAKSYDEAGDPQNAKKNYELAVLFTSKPSDNGPFYHGTKADMQVGDSLTPGKPSNYKAELVMNHIYFTALVNGAGLAAALAKGEGRERVYLVEPTGDFEDDPNVTNKKFPGNPTRSYRTQLPLKIVGEVRDWARTTPEYVQRWREKLAKSKGNIIN